MEILVTVRIPAEESCRDERRCVFAKYSKGHCGYNCALYGRLLRGGEPPLKCPECAEYVKEYCENAADPAR